MLIHGNRYFFEKIAYLEPKITKKGKCTNLALPFAGRAAKNLAFCEPFLAQRDSSIVGSSPGGEYTAFFTMVWELFSAQGMPRSVLDVTVPAQKVYCSCWALTRSRLFFFHSCHELMMFCHILYTQQHIGLIVKRKAHQLLAEGNKIVTKKRRNRFVVGFMCKSNKSPPTIKVKLAKRRILFFFSPAYIFCCL